MFSSNLPSFGLHHPIEREVEREVDGLNSYDSSDRTAAVNEENWDGDSDQINQNYPFILHDQIPNYQTIMDDGLVQQHVIASPMDEQQHIRHQTHSIESYLNPSFTTAVDTPTPIPSSIPSYQLQHFHQPSFQEQQPSSTLISNYRSTSTTTAPESASHHYHLHPQPTTTNNYHTQPSQPTTTSPIDILSIRPNQGRALCACVPCRRLKASCDNQRPCSRCVAKGRQCTDRSEEEIKMAQPNKKRSHLTSSESTSAAVTASSIAAAANSALNSVPNTPSSAHAALPFSYWSRSFLNILIQSGVRDSILKIQAKFDTMPVELPNLLEWHSQVSFMCAHFADQMTPDDLLQFLTQGLSNQILSSRLWTSSPFAPWTKLSTRPFFIVWSTLPSTAATPPNHPSAIPSDVAELYFEFAPSSNVGYQRFLQMQTARIMFERKLSLNGRIRQLPGSPNLGTFSTTPLHRTNGVHPSLSGISDSSVSEPTPDTHGDSDMTALEKSTSAFTFLDMAASLSVPPANHLVEDENERGVLHANWCPMSQPAPESSSSNKLKRTNLVNSVHGSPQTAVPTVANLDQIPLSDLLSSANSSFRCICSLSTPLPITIRTNAAFERLFGWRRIEIEQEMQCEGSKFSFLAFEFDT